MAGDKKISELLQKRLEKFEVSRAKFYDSISEGLQNCTPQEKDLIKEKNDLLDRLSKVRKRPNASERKVIEAAIELEMRLAENRNSD